MNIVTPKRIELPPPRDILGVGVSPIEWGEALKAIHAMIAARQHTKITFLNAHNANLICRDREFASVIDEFVVLPDGIGVDIASSVLYGEKFPDNLNGTDFVPAIFKEIKVPLTVGLLGARPDNVEIAAHRLALAHPQHRFEVISDGYFTPEQEPGILAKLQKLKPDILLVAMGVPRQELWIAGNLSAEHATLAFAVGALVDFQSGAIPRAPGWMRKLRMEWVFRLMLEPGRMWRRYLLGNPEFFLRALRQRLTGNTGFPPVERPDRR